MQKKTIALFSVLVSCIVAIVYYFHTHQLHLMDVQSGGMSETTKQHFLDEGIVCHETYEVQGYESLEGILKMFNIQGAHGFYALNPGASMDLKKGQVLCVRGVWDVAARASGVVALWFWPATLVGAALLGFSANAVVRWLWASPSPAAAASAGPAAVTSAV